MTPTLAQGCQACMGAPSAPVFTQHERGTHTCVFLPFVTQLVSFQRIQLGKDSC